MGGLPSPIQGVDPTLAHLSINPIVGVYIPIVRIPIKGGMTIPNITTFDHGTNGDSMVIYINLIESSKKKRHLEEIRG